MIKFVGYRKIKGSKDGKSYEFILGFFEKEISSDSPGAAGVELLLNKGRVPTVSNDFISRYPLNTVFSELYYNSFGRVESGIKK